MMLRVLLIAAVLRCSTAQVSQDDLKRAKTKKPGNDYRGPDQTTMSKTLNGHLKRSEKSTLPCEHWSTTELQNFMATIGEHRSEELQTIYRATSDRRDVKVDALEDHKAQWTKLNRITSNHPHLYAPLQDAHCREAVMWWVHHLSEEKKGFLRATNITVPLLPESEKKQCGQGEGHDEEQVCVHINEKNSCDWCHSTQ